MAPLAVDPAALDGAGTTVISVGESLGSVISTLTTALAGCEGMAGDDPAGSAFGRSYNTSSSKLLQAMAATRNGLCRLGDGVRMSAHNYSMADSMSNVSGRSQPLPGPHPTGSIAAPSAPSAVGGGVGAPAGWGWVAKYIGMIWPTGDSAKLRAAAAAWTSAGANFEVSDILGVTGPMASIGAQQIPETAAIATAFGDANRSAAGILQQCAMIVTQLNTLAANVDTVHAAILDLLSRICDPMTGIKEVWEFLTDEDEDEIEKIANDIRIVVNQFTSEVQALSQQISTSLTEATTILTTMGRYAEKEWDQFLHHTDVGRALNQVGQFGKGLGEEVGGLLKDGWTYGPIREFVDPQGSQQSWKELLHGMAPLVGLGGDQAPGVAQSWKDLGKNAVHWDEWSTNPAEAAGKSTFDIATLLVPGGGEAAAATKGAHVAADAAEAASRGEAAAAGGLREAAIPHAPASAPHPETPPPRPSAPPVDRPPPTDKPVASAPTKPTSAPTDAPTPHGPTESKPSAAANPESSGPRAAPPADQHPVNAPASPGDPAAPGHPQAFEPVTTHPSAAPDGSPRPSPSVGEAPHGQMPELSPSTSHPSPPPDTGAGLGHGHPSEGGATHGSHPGGNGIDPHMSHPSLDGPPPEHPGAAEDHNLPGDGIHDAHDGGSSHHDTPEDGFDGQPAHLPNHEVHADAEHPGAATEPQHQLTNGEPVNVATGEYTLPTVDVDLPGTLPLRVTRRHRSQFRHGLWFGPSWASTFDSRAVITDSGVITIDSEGTILVFDHPALGIPCAPRHGGEWMLHAEQSGGYRLDEPRGTRSVHFTPLPQLAGADIDAGVIAASAITDHNDNRVSFIYNEIGLPTRIEHSGGYAVDVTCSGGRIRGYTSAGRTIRQFDYVDGDLTSVENGVGAVTRFSYDGAHRLVSWTDSIGGQYNNTYDHAGRVVSQTGTDGIWAGTFEYRHDENGRSTVFADALGRTTMYEFDEDLRPRVVTDPTGCATRTNFAATLNPLTRVNAAGGTTRYRYGDDNRLAELTDSLGHVQAFTYNDGLLTQIISPDGARTRYEYDRRGNISAVYDAAGAVHRWERDESGSIRAYVDPVGRRNEITCSPAGLPLRISDAQGNQTRFKYDDFGRPTSITHADGTTTVTEYDAEGRRVSRRTSDGSQESWIHDGEGNCVAFTNGAGATTRWEYGYYDLVTARVDADGTRTEYSYNAARQLVSVTNPAGLVWTFAYRADGLLVSETDFNGATTIFTYDSAGRLESRTNAEGQTVSYTYDVAGNVITESSSSATRADDELGGEQVSYEYSVAGHRIAASSPAGRLDLLRDQMGRIIGETWNGRTVASTLDAAGNPIQIQTPSGLTTRISYDARGLAESLTVDDRPCEITTDVLGRPTKYRYGTVDVDSVWDQMGRLAARSVSTEMVADFASATYSYRADGTLTNVSHSGNGAVLGTVARYDTDITGRLIARITDDSRQTFDFDDSQNLSSRGNQRSQYRGVLLIDDGRSRYRYDRAGRLATVTTRRLGRKPDVWQYKWDAWDRLRALVTPRGAIFRYTYDPLGRRVTKESSDRARTEFCWSQTRMVEQLATASDATRILTSWSYLPGELSPQIQVSQDEVDREFFALVADQVGSPTAILDPSTETLAGQSHTDAWGLARWTGVSTPWRFPGQYHDEESGLHYNFHRYYDPDAGRYISPDPLGLAPAPNPYGYPANPTGWIDPLGLNPCQGGPPGSEVLHHYGPHEDGPLPRALVDTFRSGTYTEMVTTERITLYRAYTDGAHPLGNYWSRDVPMGPMQTQMDSALNPAWGNQATAISKIEVPAGTTFYEGIVGPQPIPGGGILLGGGDQIVFTPGFRVPMDWLR